MGAPSDAICIFLVALVGVEENAADDGPGR
jgi:hypothetical protein